MPKTARRNSVLLFAALCVPHLLFVFLHGVLDGRPAPVSYYTRCGGDYTLWLLCCCAVSGMGCLAAAAVLVYSARQRAKGHPLNGITYSWAGFAASVGLLSCAAFFNMAHAPCWVVPLLYSAVATAAGWVSVHTMRRSPTLIRVPNFEIDHLIRAGEERLQRLQEAPGGMTPEEDHQFAPLLAEILENLKQINSRPKADGGAQ